MRTILCGATFAVVLLSALHGHASGASAQNQAAQDPLPEAAGKATLVNVCGSCDEVDTAIGLRRDSAGWKDVVDSMINRGATGSENEIKAVVSYLSKNFGLVNVNKAAAKETEDVLEVSARDAEALVKQRIERGGFSESRRVEDGAGHRRGRRRETQRARAVQVAR